jgi:Zn-dependent protease with chaperone function
LGEYVAESLLHALVAALVVEGLLRVWRLDDPAERLRYRLLVLIAPLVLPLAFALAAPGRATGAFADTRALFALSHWSGVRLAGVQIDRVAVWLGAALGVVLFLRDLAPVVRGGRRRMRARGGEACEAVAPEVSELAALMGLPRPPAIRCVPSDAPVLFAAGFARPALVVSTGALSRLGGPARRAALAHELAHLQGRDLVMGWTVMLVRAALVLNPVSQIVARAVVLEMERRADDRAARVAGGEALAEAMAALSHGRRPRRAAGRDTGPFNEFLADLAARGRVVAIERRRARLLGACPPAPRVFPAARFGLAAAAVTALLFFVV